MQSTWMSIGVYLAQAECPVEHPPGRALWIGPTPIRAD
jgi:hypothetical protein